MSTELEGKGSPYANRLAEYAQAAMRDRHEYRETLSLIEYMAKPESGGTHRGKTFAIRQMAREALREYGEA